MQSHAAALCLTQQNKQQQHSRETGLRCWRAPGQFAPTRNLSPHAVADYCSCCTDVEILVCVHKSKIHFLVLFWLRLALWYYTIQIFVIHRQIAASDRRHKGREWQQLMPSIYRLLIKAPCRSSVFKENGIKADEERLILLGIICSDMKEKLCRIFSLLMKRHRVVWP